MKKILKDLRKHIRKDFGKKCPDFHWGCTVCSVHMALEILEDMYLSDIRDVVKPPKSARLK